MKVKNRYNIGDYIWIDKNNPTRHRIKAIEVFISPNTGISIFYVLEGIPPEYRGFREEECFLSKNECIQGKTYGAVKATTIRFNSVLVRLCLIVAMALAAFPFLITQIVYWLFTGKKEPLTYGIMSKICNKLSNE